MHAVPPGPEQDRLVRRVHADMARQRNEVLGSGPVVGLADSALGAGFVASSHHENGLRCVDLGYGDARASDGPFVVVRTSWLPAADEPSLRSLLADERERAFHHAGLDTPDPDSFRAGIDQLLFNGTWLAATSRTEGDLWAARVELRLERRCALVTVVSRGVAAGALELTPVSDLAPYWAAREQWLAEMAVHTPRTKPQLPEALGLEGHEALVAMVLSRRDPRAATRREHRLPPEWSAVWNVATRAQMRLATQSEAEAYDAVNAMANQLQALAATVPWWPAHGAAAVAETIRHTVFDSDVPSRPAQELWLASARHDARRRAAWLAEWAAWAERRS